jgi:hypothetical protein
MSRRAPFLLALFLILTAGSAYPCSCITPTLPEAVDRADSIFLGAVESLSVMDGRKLVILRVERSWKGNPGSEANIVTELDGAACGVDFLPGETWVVFATNSDWPSAGWSYTHLCTLNAPADTPYGQQIIENLDALPTAHSPWGSIKALYR